MNPPHQVGAPSVKKLPVTQTGHISLPTDATDTASAICARAEKVANSRQKQVRFNISGIPMTCDPGEDGDDLFSRWWLLFKKREKEA